MSNTQMSKEWKDNLNDKKDFLEFFRIELIYLRRAVYESERKRKNYIRKKIMKKLTARKRNEAFPRKSGKYNELFQDLGKESGARDNQGQVA